MAVKQDDVQRVGIWLASELPYELASEAFELCTGSRFSAHCLHEAVKRAAQDVNVLNACPTKEEVYKKIAGIA